MGADYSEVGRLLANPARSAMVDALMAGRPLAAGELARIGRVRPSTASEHLAELSRGGLVRVEAHGRHRYYAVAGADVARALEALSLICPATPVRTLRASLEARTLGFARTCYDHVAGVLGVALHDALVGRGWLAIGSDGYALTAPGSAALADLGIAAAPGRRPLARPCLDWTERRAHLAGGLGAALATTLLERQWLERRGRRGLEVTAPGRSGLAGAFGVDVDELAARPLAATHG